MPTSWEFPLWRRAKRTPSGADPPPHLRPGHVLNRKRRTTVSVVLHDGELAVKKSFAPGYERYLAREVDARRVLSARVPEIPPLLACGSDHFVSPYYVDAWQYDRRGWRMFPLATAKRVLDAFERVYAAGYALLDAHPGNLLVDRSGQLKFFDLEFCRPYGANQPESFDRSWDLVRPPPALCGEAPPRGAVDWDHHWKKFVGLSPQELRADPIVVQHLKRARHWLLVFLPRQMQRRMRPAVVQRAAALKRRLKGTQHAFTVPLPAIQDPRTADGVVTTAASSSVGAGAPDEHPGPPSAPEGDQMCEESGATR